MDWYRLSQKRENAEKLFASRCPKFYKHLMECCRTGDLLEIFVYPPVHNMYSVIGFTGQVSEKDGEVVIEFEDIFSSRRDMPNYSFHYDTISHICLWNDQGEKNPDIDIVTCTPSAGGGEIFPYDLFFSSGEAESYHLIPHPSVKNIGSKIYEAIKKTIISNSRRGQHLTEKQTLIEISRIIADITSDRGIIECFQDASDDGFSGSEED